jgi:antitoxin MazE
MSRSATITAEIIPIGNSKGIRIPKSIREQVRLEGEVTLTVANDALVIRPKRAPRADWHERFARLPKKGQDELLIPDHLETDFDIDWTW